MLFTIEEMARATGGSVNGSGATDVCGVSTDSRSVKPGELFVALAGPNFDGHDFIPGAAATGVKAFLVHTDWLAAHGVPAGTVCIAVPDTLRGLGDLAACHRARFDLPVVGVTGSNGKTTTKEMLAAILELSGPGLKTSGNLNNLIGLPQMLFRLTSEHRWAVLEMGMSEPGEIDRLAEIARPAVGIITNALPAHLESMGSVENVASAKGELFLRLPAGGVAVANADDPLVSILPAAKGVKRVAFGLKGGDVTASALERLGREGQRFILDLHGTRVGIELAAFGRHNVYNAVAAAAAAEALGIGPDTIREGLASFRPVAKRFTVEEAGGIVLIDDSYNANPASMAAALVTLSEVKDGRRAVAVLGDMLELGQESAAAHRNVGRLAASSVERLYVMGKMAAEMAEGALEGGLAEEGVLVMRSHADILADLKGWLMQGDCVLVKGSRGMGMDAVAEGLRKRYAAPEGKGTVA